MNIFEQILNWLKGVSKTSDPDIGDAGQLPQENDSNHKDNSNFYILKVILCTLKYL